ncbi:hypothetical protein Tco_0750164 [Tanacetum coccineum]|uniref:Reverse transcriptase domain-containing protein n=1 Tax=Tanacetum coccineum TaxID=301880 RepID=A0ABQ4Z0H7_9ASTR
MLGGSDLKGNPSTTKPTIEERVKVAINLEYPEQTVMIGSTLTEEGCNKLCNLLQRNLDIFAWKLADMTGVPRHIAEHRLNVWKNFLRVRQKKKRANQRIKKTSNTGKRIHKDGDGDASFQLKSNSLPHAHAHSTKTFYKHQDSRIMKAQELKTKTSANSDINDNSSEIKLRGRLLESFQDDAKYEHVGQDTRSQGGKDVKDKQG